MITAGIDIGAGTTKGVLLEDGRRILAVASAPTRADLAAAATGVRRELEEQGNVTSTEVDYVCTTGFGRYAVEERNLQVSDITSTARGAWFLHPETRHVIDIGCQSSRAVAVDARGRVVKFRMNQKCAAGGGRFVERCSKYLQVPMDVFAERAMRASQPRTISSVCAVLAESEVINYITEEVPVEDILMGVLQSLAERAHGLMKTVGVEPDVSLAGGLARNPAMVRALTTTAGAEVHVEPLSTHAAALGSALLGHVRLKKKLEATP